MYVLMTDIKTIQKKNERSRSRAKLIIIISSSILIGVAGILNIHFSLNLQSASVERVTKDTKDVIQLQNDAVTSTSSAISQKLHKDDGYDGSGDGIVVPSLQPIQNRTIMLVHIGKAAGSTLLRSFYQAQWQSGNKLQRTPVLLPICHMHACTNKTLYKATTLLYVIRNPVDRMISAYKFSHPDNCITYDQVRKMNITNDIWGCHMPMYAKQWYHECAPTLEQFAKSPFDASSSTSYCRHSIRGMVSGGNERYRKQSTHAYFNYAHYRNVTIQRFESRLDTDTVDKKEIFVLRTEHLWQDASTLDIQLNGTGKYNTTASRNVTHGSETYHKHTSTLSKVGYERICCMLIDEINVFEDILYRGENLSMKDKIDTIRDVERKCGILKYTSRKEWATECKDKLVDDAIT